MAIALYSVDDDLLAATQQDGRTRTRVSHPDQAQVVLGRASDPARELFLDACQTDGVALLRRHGGGCAVVLDPGCVVVSVCLRAPGIGHNRRWFDRINQWLLSALHGLGATAVTTAGISDLVLADRKVGGSSLYRSRDTAYYSASLLVDPPVALMNRYLKHPPREPDYRRHRPHQDFVTGLSSILNNLDAPALATELRQKFRGRVLTLDT